MSVLETVGVVLATMAVWRLVKYGWSIVEEWM